MRSLSEQIHLHHSAKKVFNAITTPSSIRQWWHANQVIIILKSNGIYAVQWGQNIDHPEYITNCRISELVHNHVLELEYLDYLSPEGKLPFEAHFKVRFNIEQQEAEQCILSIEQSGFPDDRIADSYYNGCVQGWKEVFQSIDSHLNATHLID